MAQEEKFDFGGIHRYVRTYIRQMPRLDGKVVVDIPCGDGRSTWEFLQKGASVRPFDLFPEFMALDGVNAEFADLADGLQIGRAHV